MSKLTKSLFSFSAKGSLGKAISFRRKGSQTIAEKTPIPPDAKSLAQLSWRHMYQKAVALWHALSVAEKTEWESNARPRHMTGFAWFMSQCLKPNPGIYLPLQGGIMQGNIDMATHLILNLPEPTADEEPTRKAELDTHAALAAIHHARYTNAEALAAAIAGGLSEVIWIDASVRVLSDLGRTVTLNWTDLDLTAHTSANAKFAIVGIVLQAPVSGTAADNAFRIRKNGTTPTYSPSVQFSSVFPGWTFLNTVALVALDGGQVIEYSIVVATNATLNSYLDIYGYIE